jgi:hypothetical protein
MAAALQASFVMLCSSEVSQKLKALTMIRALAEQYSFNALPGGDATVKAVVDACKWASCAEQAFMLLTSMTAQHFTRAHLRQLAHLAGSHLDYRATVLAALSFAFVHITPGSMADLEEAGWISFAVDCSRRYQEDEEVQESVLEVFSEALNSEDFPCEQRRECLAAARRPRSCLACRMRFAMRQGEVPLAARRAGVETYAWLMAAA